MTRRLTPSTAHRQIRPDVWHLALAFFRLTVKRAEQMQLFPEKR